MAQNSALSGPVAQVVKHEGQQDLAFVDLGSRASDQLRESWGSEAPFRSGHAIESVWLQPLLGGGALTREAGSTFDRGEHHQAKRRPGASLLGSGDA